MNELIKTSASMIGGEAQQTVNARELWRFLESGTQFNHWINRRIKDYGFVKGQDFTMVKKDHGKNGQFSATDYHISLDMAKELAMVENNDQGRRARQYFIEIEKEYRKQYQASEKFLSGPETAIVVQHVAKILIPILEERARDKAQIEFSRNFLPLGNPGDINKNGEHKTRFRRGYYCAGKGRNITALIERMEQPGLFDEIQLNVFPNLTIQR